MADLGTAYVRIAPNMTGIQGKIAKGMKGSGTQATKQLSDEINAGSGRFQKSLDKLGGFAKKGGKIVAGGLAAGAVGIGVMVKNMVEGAAELEQQIGGSEVVFGEFADTIQEKSKTAFKEAGLSQAEFLQGANKMGSLFQGSGLTAQESMEATTNAIQRASDVASIMGISTQDALEAVTGAAKGNFTMMDNLGVKMNATSLEAAALEKGLDKTFAQMTEGEKAMLAQEVFMDATANAAGNYAKENKTLSGSLNTTQKAFDNLMSGSGDVGDFIESLVGTIEIAVPQIINMLPQVVDGISSVISAIGPAIGEALPKLVPAVIKGAVNLFKEVQALLPTVVQVLVDALPMFIDGFIQIFLGIVEAMPGIVRILSGAIPEVVDALVSALTAPSSLTAIVMGAVELLLAMVEAIPVIIDALVSAIPSIVSNILKTLTSRRFIEAMFRAGVKLLTAVVKGIMSILGSVGSAAWRIVSSISSILSPSRLIRVGSSLISGLWSGLSRIGSWLRSRMSSGASSAISAVKSVLTPSSLFSVGTSLITGLWNGINSMGGWLRSKIIGFVADKIPGPVKKALGINSPSRLFAEFGRNIDEGLAQGILKHADMVENSVNTMADRAISGMTGSNLNADIQASGSVSGAIASAATTSTSNQTVSINQVTLGDQGAVQEFFKQLNKDTISVGMGLTPAQGA